MLGASYNTHNNLLEEEEETVSPNDNNQSIF